VPIDREVDPSRQPRDGSFEALVLEGRHLAAALANEMVVVLAGR